MSSSDFKTSYSRFCANAPADFPVFMQDWYLDAVCESGVWDVAIATKNGDVVGVWPYFMKKKGLWQYIAMPGMGKLMGPYIVPEHRQISSEMRILQELLEQIPKGLAAFDQDCNYTFQNWLPMYWQGFTQTTRYSYHIDLQKTMQELWSGVENNYKGKINKSRDVLMLRHDRSLEELFEVSMMSFTRQGLSKPFSLAYFKKINAAFEMRGASEKFFIVNSETGDICSAGYLVWDKSTAYSFMSGDDPAFRSSGSGVRLFWEKVLHSRENLQLQYFDFMGSMLQNVEQGRRHFGAVQQPYFRLKREWSPLWKWGKALLR